MTWSSGPAARRRPIVLARGSSRRARGGYGPGRAARLPDRRRGHRRGSRGEARALQAPRRGALRRRGARHHNLVAVGVGARGSERAARPLRRPARVQPGAQDGAGRAVLPRRRAPSTRARLRELCASARQDRGRGARLAGFVVNKLLFPYLFDAVRLLERNGLDAEVDRHVHEARRRPPDGTARAARLRRPRRGGVNRRVDRRATCRRACAS